AVGSTVRLALTVSVVLILLQAFVVFRKAGQNGTGQESAPYYLVGCLAILPIALLVTAFAWLWLTEPRVDVGINLLVSMLGCVALVLLVAAAIRAGRAMAGPPRRHLAVLIVSVATLLMTGGLVWFLARQRTVSKLFVDRMSQGFDGTSPGLPIVTLALAIFAW